MDRRSIIKNAIPVMILSLITACLLCIQISIAKQTKSTLPYAIELRSERGLNLNFDEISEFLDNATGVSVSKAMISSELSTQNISVNLRATDGNYAQIMPVDIIRGNYFFIEPSPLQNEFVVISDKLAVKFFRSEDVVGKSITVNGETHSICGVYRSDEAIMSRISSNGLDTVYLPYKSISEYEKLPIHMLYVKKQTKFIDSVVDEITQKLGKQPMPDTMSNYNDSNTIIGQAPKITLFFVGILTIITLIWIMVPHIAKAYRFYKGDDKKSALIHMGIVFVCIVVALFLLKLVLFHLYLPASILPNDNILDLKHYFELIVQAINKRNGFLLYDYYWNYSFVAMRFGMITATLSVVTLLVTWICGAFLAKHILEGNECEE
ncbi:MAG: ABC transporter permease [Oscillospiraceae bacterium]